MRWETRVSSSVLSSSLPQLVDGQCPISLQKAEFQGVLEKLHISINDLPGLCLYVVAAVIESPGEWLPLILTMDPHSDLRADPLFSSTNTTQLPLN